MLVIWPEDETCPDCDSIIDYYVNEINGKHRFHCLLCDNTYTVTTLEFLEKGYCSVIYNNKIEEFIKRILC